MSFLIVLVVGRHQRGTGFSQRYGVIEGVEQMLFERYRKIAGFVVGLYACDDRKFKRVQKGHGLTSTARIEPCDHCSCLGQPVRRLQHGHARFFNELENLKSLERV